MKNISKLLIFGFGALLFSCNDAIDIKQPGRLDADAAFETVDDLQAGLFGTLNTFDTTSDIAFGSVFTDELSIGFDSGGQGFADYGFVLNAGSPAAAVFWTRGYRQINSATRLIEASKLITPEAGDVERFNDIVGQAYALRAFAHFELLSYFSTDLTDDNALGVIAVDFVPSVDQKLLRNTNGEVFALINSDLDQASNLLDNSFDPVYVSKDFVTALRARIAIFRGNYPEAATLAQQLVSKYPLANRAEYEGIFNDVDNTEIIFKLERTLNDSYDGQGATGSIAAGGWAGARFAFVDATLDGSPYFEMGRSLFNLLDPDDIRYDVNVAPTSVIDPDYQNSPDPSESDKLVIQKYPGSEGQPLLNDLKVFRSSEMLLILAEARADAGSFNGATNSTASAIKQLRDARFVTPQPLPVYANQTEAFAAVLNERRIELAFEGFRYKDLKRLGERANQGVLKDPVDCEFNGACTLSPTDFRFTMPLPIVEFNANPGLREQQNPGY